MDVEGVPGKVFPEDGRGQREGFAEESRGSLAGVSREGRYLVGTQAGAPGGCGKGFSAGSGFMPLKMCANVCISAIMWAILASSVCNNVTALLNLLVAPNLIDI